MNARSALAGALVGAVALGGALTVSSGPASFTKIYTAGMVTGNGSAGSPLKSSPIISSGWFGDGVDGSVTLTTSTTLTQDMFYETLTLNAGVRLDVGGFRLHVRTVLTLNAGSAVSRDGNPGTTGTGGAALVQGSLPASRRGANQGETGPGANDAPLLFTSTGPSTTTGGVGQGGHGGIGGGVNSNDTGADGATYGVALGGAWSDIETAYRGILINGTVPRVSGGGGSGGRGYNGDISNGGGGGGGGGYMVVAAREIVGPGKIEVIGGHGGPGDCGNVGMAPGGGGGGGGGGGLLMLITSTKQSDWYNVDVSGGAGGLRGIGCPTADGQDGYAGGSGIVMYYPVRI